MGKNEVKDFLYRYVEGLITPPVTTTSLDEGEDYKNAIIAKNRREIEERKRLGMFLKLLNRIANDLLKYL